MPDIQYPILYWSFHGGPNETMGFQRALRSSTIVQSQNPSISELRAEYAMRFLEPAPHMALAKYFRDKGNRLEAFYILETARRSRLEEDEFNQAFALNAW